MLKQKTQEKRQLCPNCKRHNLAEELLLIPKKEGRREYLYCVQCEGEFPCNEHGERVKPRRIVGY